MKRWLLAIVVLACSAPEENVAVAEAHDQASAIRIAEAFVRAQGYTDTAPTVSGDEIVHEGIEGTMDDRRDMLEPRAASASGRGTDWDVVFRYRDPAFAGRGRVLRLRAGERPSFVHQDLVLDPAP